MIDVEGVRRDLRVERRLHVARRATRLRAGGGDGRESNKSNPRDAIRTARPASTTPMNHFCRRIQVGLLVNQRLAACAAEMIRRLTLTLTTI